MSLLGLFVHPLQLPADATLLWLVVPLTASVAITYKTVRARTLRRLWLHILLLIIYILGGMALLGVGLWLFAEYWQ